MSSGSEGETASYQAICAELLESISRTKAQPSVSDFPVRAKLVSPEVAEASGSEGKPAGERIQFVSDIHLEFFDLKQTEWGPGLLSKLGDDFTPEASLAASFDVDITEDIHQYFAELVRPGPAPFLALLGDIGTPIAQPKASFLYGLFLRWTALHWARVFVVLGNHEGYSGSGYTWQDCLAIVQKHCANCSPGSLTLMDRTRVEVGSDVVLLGCTLWYNIPQFKELPDLPQLIEYRVNDFRRIQTKAGAPKGRYFRYTDVFSMHCRDLAWLDEQIRAIHTTSPGKAVVVLTHHAPVWSASNPDFCLRHHPYMIFTDGSLLDHLFSNPVVAWLFGHTHVVMAEQQRDTLVCTNARGYRPNITAGYSPTRYLECSAQSGTQENLTTP